MKGTVFKSTSSNGRITWRFQITAGRDENGKRRRVSESGFRLEREATEAMHAKMRELKHGAVNTATSLSEYLERWLPYHAKAKPLSPLTVVRYESLAAHATRALGSVALKDLT